MTTRPNISHELASEIRSRIVRGKIGAGERINEVHLAAELEVSRTPLREALSRLAAEGALEVRPRRGFYVRPLSLQEFDDIYAIRPLLDPEALRLAGRLSESKIRSLENLNRQLAKASDVETAIDLDDRWHVELVDDCGNQTLIDLIQQFMARTRRYEMALLDKPHHLEAACRTHRQILSKIKRHDMAGACEHLRKNLLEGSPKIRSWLLQRLENDSVNHS